MLAAAPCSTLPTADENALSAMVLMKNEFLDCSVLLSGIFKPHSVSVYIQHCTQIHKPIQTHPTLYTDSCTPIQTHLTLYTDLCIPIQTHLALHTDSIQKHPTLYTGLCTPIQTRIQHCTQIQKPIQKHPTLYKDSCMPIQSHLTVYTDLCIPIQIVLKFMYTRFTYSDTPSTEQIHTCTSTQS